VIGFFPPKPPEPAKPPAPEPTAVTPTEGPRCEVEGCDQPAVWEVRLALRAKGAMADGVRTVLRCPAHLKDAWAQGSALYVRRVGDLERIS